MKKRNTAKQAKPALRQKHEAPAPSANAAARKRANTVARKPFLKHVGMRFYARAGEVLRELRKCARAACAKTGSGSFTFSLGGKALCCTATYHGAGDKTVPEPEHLVRLGDYLIALPEQDDGADYQHLAVHADVSLCCGRTVAEVVVHMTNFIDALVDEIVTGELYWTNPQTKPPEFDEERPHVGPPLVPRMLRMQTTPRYSISRAFARWLASTVEPKQDPEVKRI